MHQRRIAANDSRLHIPAHSARKSAFLSHTRHTGRHHDGRQEGLWIGKILALEELMGLTPTDGQALASLSIPELERRYGVLRREYDTRFRR